MTISGRLALLSLSALLSAALSAGCEGCGCGGGAYVGELTSATGAVERDHDEARDRWTAASEGERFQIGDGLRTGEGGAAVVQLSQGGRLRLGERSFVRFLASAPESAQPRLELGGGGAQVSGGEVGVELQTPGGRLVVEETSEVDVDLGEGDSLRFEVTLGQVRFIDREERAHRVDLGEEFVVNLETGAVTRSRRPEEAAEVEDAGAREADAGIDQGPIQILVDGSGAESRGPDDRGWSSLPEGPSQVRDQTAVRLARRTAMHVRRVGARISLRGSARATLGGGPGSVLAVAAGRASGESGSSPATIGVPGGAVVLRPSARADVRVGRGGVAEVAALGGQVEVRGEGDPHVLELGERATLSAEGEVEVHRNPTRSALTILAGVSARVHDPSPPTNVAFRFGEACAGEGLIEVPQGEDEPPLLARGSGRAILRLPAGAHDYRLRCVVDGAPSQDLAAEGSLRIMADPGTTPMPTTPARHTVDADGRSYSVLYQNVLPQITFRWSDAPEASSYTLHLDAPGGRTVAKSGSRPSHTFHGGTLSEGGYRFSFSAASGRRSPETRLSIRFDTAVATASISEPVNGTITPGSTVRVAGIALRGSTVQVGAVTVPFDSPFRFAGEVTVPADEEALAIRVTHPSGGTHFFLRRTAGGE